MARFLPLRSAEPAPNAPVLHLSGPRLRRAFEHLVESAEPTGGIERYVSALALKASLFTEVFGEGGLAELTPGDFRDAAAFITPARRRIGPYLGDGGFAHLRAATALLVESPPDLNSADARLERFIDCFPRDKAHRWVRDLGAEILHFTHPSFLPLMTRWVWDAGTGTGVLREVWFEEAPAGPDGLPDDARTFAALNDELGGFLSDNGVFRDHALYADLLCAHVYAGYINDQGGQYLRADFSDDVDPMMHTRRMLGLDAINTETGRTRLKLIDGTAHVLSGDPLLLS